MTLRRTRYRVSFVVVVAATTAYSVLQSLVLPVLPTLQRSLHTTQSTVTWVLTAYLLAASVATPIVGRLGDLVGKKKTMVGVLVVFALGTLLAALANSVGVMIAARVIQGAGGAILPLAFGILRDECPSDRVRTAVGTTAGVSAVAAGLGIVLAGPIVEALDFRFLFWIPLILIVVALVAAGLVIPESPHRSRGRITAAATVLLTAWLVALLVVVSEATSWGWGAGRTVGLLAASAVLIVLWVVVESRASQPVVDMKMMRLPAVWTANLVALLFGAGMYSVLAFLPEFLQTPRSAGYGFSASITASGLFLLPLTVGMFIFGLWSGSLSDRLGPKTVVVIGSAIAVVPFALLAFAHHQAWELYLASALLGVGFGLVFAAMSNIIVESVPSTQTGVATGMNANIRTIGGAIGAAIMGSIVTARLSSHGIPAESGYTRGFLFLLIASAVAAAAALAIPTARHQVTDAERAVTIADNPEVASVPGAPRD